MKILILLFVILFLNNYIKIFSYLSKKYLKTIIIINEIENILKMN